MSEKKENNNGFNEEELLKKVEKAAQKGANKASLSKAFVSSLPSIIMICLLAVLIVPKIYS